MSRETLEEYLARGGSVVAGDYVPRYGDNVKRTPMGPRATSRGRKSMLEKGCPRCGRDLTEAEIGEVSAVFCGHCGEEWRAATGDDLPSRESPHKRYSVHVLLGNEVDDG